MGNKRPTGTDFHSAHRLVPLRVATALLLLALVAASRPGRADTVASLLGNFTINQFCGLQLADESISVHYAVVFGQLPALRELHEADTNGDGVTSQSERDAYVQRLAPAACRRSKADFRCAWMRISRRRCRPRLTPARTR